MSKALEYVARVRAAKQEAERLGRVASQERPRLRVDGADGVVAEVDEHTGHCRLSQHTKNDLSLSPEAARQLGAWLRDHYASEEAR